MRARVGVRAAVGHVEVAAVCADVHGAEVLVAPVEVALDGVASTWRVAVWLVVSECVLLICVTSFALRYASRGVAVSEHARWVSRAVPFCLLPTSSHLPLCRSASARPPSHRGS